MGLIFVVIYFLCLVVGMMIATGHWGLGVAAIVLLGYLVAREVGASHVLDEEERRRRGGEPSA